MIKTLRSVIHEKFPFDLRVKLELLSRRRDIQNKEKQEELFKLLQGHGIDDIIPLGSGTNRYAFKISGFVIKFATDNDGKIDNLKEFKMAKVLYPYVIKVFEISENGTMLVTEYIQPFESYTEMLKYQERICKILSELSSMYLIGDVGISENNFSNWGIRIGTDNPVCLDFAYVYEVSSSLFLCKKCKINAMIIPNARFTSLYCSNPSCSTTYPFESLRGKISNEAHEKEIGNLVDDGYLLSNTNQQTELIPNKSRYLMKKETEQKQKEITKPEVIDTIPGVGFVMPDPPTNIFEEELLMSKKSQLLDNLRESIRISVDRGVEEGRVIYGFVMDDPEKSMDSGVAYIGTITEEDTETMEMNFIEKDLLDNTLKDLYKRSHPEIADRPLADKFDIKTFKCENIPGSISRISNMISDYLIQENVFIEYLKDHVSGFYSKEINVAFTAKDFYVTFQKCVYNTLLDFNGIKRSENSHGAFKFEETENRNTLIFFDRMYHNNSMEDPIDSMYQYREMFCNCDGIEEEWLDLLKNRLTRKFIISKEGLDIITGFLRSVWISGDDESVISTDISDDHLNIDSALYDDFDDQDEEDDDEEDDENEIVEGIEIKINSDSVSIISLSSSLPSSGSIFTFYTNLMSIPVDKNIPSVVDNRNGMWDGLIHLIPNIKFDTTTPDLYMNTNVYTLSNSDISAEPIIVHVILDENDGIYTMGSYRVNLMDIDASDIEEVLYRINYLVQHNISNGMLSHLQRTLSLTELERDEPTIEAECRISDQKSKNKTIVISDSFNDTLPDDLGYPESLVSELLSDDETKEDCDNEMMTLKDGYDTQDDDDLYHVNRKKSSPDK